MATTHLSERAPRVLSILLAALIGLMPIAAAIFASAPSPEVAR